MWASMHATLPVLMLILVTFAIYPSYGNVLYPFNCGTGSGGESIYGGEFTGINLLTWCEAVVR
jgi:hypothetical protein